MRRSDSAADAVDSGGAGGVGGAGQGDGFGRCRTCCGHQNHLPSSAAIAGVIFLIAREVGWTEIIRKRRKPRLAPVDYRPDAEVARALLADADELAAQGRFAEAVHILLLRSIEDMQRFRPGSVRPAATSRDIAGLEVLPVTARPAFAAMAERVEVSLFGARAVDAEGFARARSDYEAFAFPKAWA